MSKPYFATHNALLLINIMKAIPRDFDHVNLHEV